MVSALFTLKAGLNRARRQRKDAGTLSLLKVIADHDGIRPSEITDLQQVHPLLVTRQISPRTVALPVDRFRPEAFLTNAPVPDAVILEIVDEVFLPLVQRDVVG